MAYWWTLNQLSTEMSWLPEMLMFGVFKVFIASASHGVRQFFLQAEGVLSMA